MRRPAQARRLETALLAAVPEASGSGGHRILTSHAPAADRRMLAPWDGPAAIVFSDGRRVGALVDRNGLRPAAFAITRDRLVAVASEAGAVPFEPGETVRRGRLGPGEMLLVEPARRASSRTPMPRRAPSATCRSTTSRVRPTTTASTRLLAVIEGRGPLPPSLRYLAGLDAEKAGSISRRWRSKVTNRCGAWATTRRLPARRASTDQWTTTSARRSPRSPTPRSIRSASVS